jgi:hypothetical protein
MKKMPKKLTLNRETIKNLQGEQLQDVQGGLPKTIYPSCLIYTCAACG